MIGDAALVTRSVTATMSPAAPHHGIADADGTSFEDDGCDAAVAAHRLIAGGADRLQHAGAGGTRAGPFQHNVAELKPPRLDRQQVDPGHDDVAPALLGLHLLDARPNWQ